jgi:hypothetical protein
MQTCVALIAKPTVGIRSYRTTSALMRRGGKQRAKKENPYAGSVILPQTDFNQRANAIVREPELQ